MDSHTEDKAFLENFWVIRRGSNVCLPDSTKSSVLDIDQRYPEQLTLDCDESRIFFAQDVNWDPSQNELIQMLRDFDIHYTEEGLVLDGIFYPKPETLSDFAGALRNLRHIYKLKYHRDLLEKHENSAHFIK